MVSDAESVTPTSDVARQVRGLDPPNVFLVFLSDRMSPENTDEAMNPSQIIEVFVNN